MIQLHFCGVSTSKNIPRILSTTCEKQGLEDASIELQARKTWIDWPDAHAMETAWKIRYLIPCFSLFKCLYDVSVLVSVQDVQVFNISQADADRLRLWSRRCNKFRAELSNEQSRAASALQANRSQAIQMDNRPPSLERAVLLKMQMSVVGQRCQPHLTCGQPSAQIALLVPISYIFP